MADDCLFCKIASGDVPATIVHEDDQVLAFEDISAQAPFHVLVIPRRHISTLNDLQDGDETLVGTLIATAARIAKEHGHAQDGYRTVFNCNRGCLPPPAPARPRARSSPARPRWPSCPPARPLGRPVRLDAPRQRLGVRPSS